MSLLERLLERLLALLGRDKSTVCPVDGDGPVYSPLSDFERALSFTLRWEGGKVDDPADPGGRTNMGITQQTYNRWNEDKGLPPPLPDVWNISPAEVANIYRERYWLAGRCDTIHWPLSLIHFDTCVQFGPPRALAIFLDTTKSPTVYLDLRRLYHQKRAEDKPSQAKFLKGWLNRCEALEKESLS